MAKKLIKIKKLIAVLLVAIGLLALCACETSEGTNPLSKEKEKEIISVFITENSDAKHPLKKEDISLRLYGAFDGVYVLFVDVVGWNYTTAIETDVIDGVEFVYSSGQKLTVYADGKFYSLSDAYDNHILSREDLLTVQKNYQTSHEYLY